MTEVLTNCFAIISSISMLISVVEVLKKLKLEYENSKLLKNNLILK